MKLITFAVDGTAHVGALLPGETSLSDFTAASGAAHFADMLALIDGGEPALDAARALVARPAVERSLDGVRLLAPVPVPRQMYDCLTFEKHLMQARANRHLVVGEVGAAPLSPLSPVFKERPVYYKPNRFSVVGTGTEVICPRYSEWFDYELEFGVFLSRSGKDLSVDEAADRIFGYCIFNDFSARDQQYREMPAMLGPSKGKDFDTGNAMGPWLVTKDEIPDDQTLTMTTRINGEVRSVGTSADMLHSFAEIIAYASVDETLHAGEFFASGTVGGGCGLEHGERLRHGDLVDLEVSGLGRLVNRVVIAAEA
ncbi:fumarylacetoacetate hydrolase family protein [Sphingomonas sp.]|uniref:fumarylacetoacetate hydrolase family protein n=1 Tax=Sphingomonas sp. TaxID=28214 RepID=UPI001B236A26|nr:fumarylacetoacetate hydrolase family protein [Sphingomonas sp.]MBO9711763.1 fumarylacetoacetate hydrolase family protein [Sphingomonas sp.]